MEADPLNYYDLLGLRALTSGEILLAQSIFGDSTNYSKVEIRQEKFAGLIPVSKKRAMIPSGKIYFHPKNSDYRLDFSASTPALKMLFIHEITHVWQHQSGINLIAAAIVAAGKYTYQLDCDKNLTDYNIEQQRQIVMDYFVSINGYNVAGTYGSQEHEQGNTTELYETELGNFLTDPGYLKEEMDTQLPSEIEID